VVVVGLAPAVGSVAGEAAGARRASIAARQVRARVRRPTMPSAPPVDTFRHMPDSELWLPPVAGAAETAAGFLAGAAGRASAPLMRPAVLSGLHRIFRGGAEAPVPAARLRLDDGWFGPGTVTWRVHADAAMFVGALAALAFQALHPLAMAGVAAHSDFREDPLGRLRRTAAFVGATVYGTSAEAERACDSVRRVHARVHGDAPDGRAYSAEDPELVDWVHVTEFAAFAAANRRFGAEPMTDGELDRYVAEVARLAVELGDPAPPRSWAELDASLEGHRPKLCVNEQSRAAWRFLETAHRVVAPPVRPAYQLLFAGAVACLPPWARRLWGVHRPSTRELAACRALVRGLGAVMGDPGRPAGAQASRSRTESMVSASSAPLSSR
jgi:uncharacterized protein (DUF2236 family)